MLLLSAFFKAIILFILTLKCSLATSTALARLLKSSCGELFQSADWIDRGHIEAMLPPIEFWDFFANRTRGEVLLVDVDKHSWVLLLNQVAALKKSDSKLAKSIYAIAYDNETCNHLVGKEMDCFYSPVWNQQLTTKFVQQTGSNNIAFLHLVMLGRMISTTVTLCEGHDVFLTDSDVVFYRDPIKYAYQEANIMITATAITAKQAIWGSTFFADQPEQFYTLNNGVVFYRNNHITRSFLLTLVAHCINSLKGQYDHDQGFLQKVFNGLMAHNKLALHPSSAISDPKTFRLNNSHVNNSVGECYDCYYGHFPWYSDVVHPSVPPSKPDVLKIGVYPMQRYTSMCHAPNITEFKKSLVDAAYALNHNDSTHWNWGALKNHTSRVLLVHANCVDERATGLTRYQKKIEWFHNMGSWFL